MNLFAKCAYIYKSGTKSGEYDEVDIRRGRATFDRYYQELSKAISRRTTRCSSATSKASRSAATKRFRE
jgi:hypothetical protein